MNLAEPVIPGKSDRSELGGLCPSIASVPHSFSDASDSSHRGDWRDKNLARDSPLSLPKLRPSQIGLTRTERIEESALGGQST